MNDKAKDNFFFSVLVIVQMMLMMMINVNARYQRLLELCDLNYTLDTVKP